MADGPPGVFDDFDGELGRFPLDDSDLSYADIHLDETFDPDEADFRDIFDALDVEVDQDFLFDQIVQDGLGGYDPTDDDARGPYDKDEVIEFLNDTGWWGIADVFWDEDTDEYYVDINYDDGANA
jgi:hypothetical protein